MGVKVEDVKVHSGVTPESNRTSVVAPDRIGQVAVVGTAVAATVGLLPWLGNSMFADEGATLYSAHLSWSNLWAQSQHVDLVMLPYYVLIHFWLMLSGSIAWVRALSLFAFFGTIVAAGGLGLRIAGRWCGIIAAVLTASSTLLILKALNARPYELSALLVALCAVTLFKWIDDSRARWLWAFSVLALLATATQLFALLAPASMLICVLAVRPRLLARRLRALLAPVVVLAVVSGAWIAASIGQVGQVNWIAQGSIGSRLSAELRGPALGQAYDLVLFGIVVLVVAKLAAIWNRRVRHAVAEQISRDRDIFALTMGWAVFPTVALSIASFAHPVYDNRYVTASAPGVALLVAFVCVRVFPATLDPARASDGTGQRRLRGRTLGVDWRRRRRRPSNELRKLGLSSSRRLARSGEVRGPTRAGRGCHRPARSRHYRGNRLLPGERRSTRSPLATTWRSTTLCRRIRPLIASVFDQSPSPPCVAGDRRQWRRPRAVREDPLPRRLCAFKTQTVHRA